MNEHLRYSAVVVTFRRPESLKAVLGSVLCQEPTPDLVVVADNDSARSAESIVNGMESNGSTAVRYVPIGENRGPAGGWAAAADEAQRYCRHGGWLLVIDDDDALQHHDVVARLLGSEPLVTAECAAIGLRGARLNRLTARLERVEPPEGEVAPVDYLASGGAALYRLDAIDEVGFFNPELFFGFEDLDLGLRLRAAGWSLWVAPQPSIHEVADSASSVVAWREYYKTRALVWVLRKHANVWATAVALTRSVLLGSLRLAFLERRPDAASARLWGVLDGLRSNLGQRRYFPETNTPKLPGEERA